ncbi:MAG TPA: hypothetical protein VM939_05095 [Gemmatimonadaceae bacterium]|nr:hypothetical protein [Gemmatimonadaceae bacterium]
MRQNGVRTGWAQIAGTRTAAPTGIILATLGAATLPVPAPRKTTLENFVSTQKLKLARLAAYSLALPVAL